jgi:hypothetical protein
VRVRGAAPPAAHCRHQSYYFEDFFDNFYNVDVLGGSRISEQAWQASFNVTAGALPYASYACVDSWLTDSAATCRRSTCRRWCTAPRTGSCRTAPPPSGCPRWSPTSGWSLSKAAHTTSPGPHPDEVNKPLLEFLAD